ncbi:hypothetical protein BU25DRAFT_455890 [Macroventuria anomochaeta]|uniref:Uncharacterized protein n=1 Tax=Macroventuria anomochaeta TaxID=301207 RepID=A0ACB6SA24_9PLEO|nr:uncharacterized protein BU25DRAFT_455890 [Macroventuria anomochaeta]KAF2630827.1 hypothetical protein BU25DRAFT_455890 [Macroventuria anomochaeta]
MTGVNVEHGYQQASTGKQFLNKDDLYFNDMDIRAWERRTAALGGAPNRNDRGYQEDEGYYNDAGEPMSAAEYEEVLFQRVLDKIRLARAADISDVQLTPEELDAYQSKLYGTRTPAARPPQSPRSSPLNDAMGVANASTTSTKGSSSSRSKKVQQRSSLFASKPKKDRPSSRKRAPSNVSSAPPPGFMIPGPDGQPIYTPINACQGNLARDPVTPPQPTSRTLSNNERPPMPVRVAPREMPGAFPGALPTSPHLYYPSTPLAETHPSPQDLALGYDGLGISTRSLKPSSMQSSMPKTTPVEPYQYHTFSSSSSTQSSPKLKYTRRVLSAESSYTAMPRRVPVPAPRPPPVQANYLDSSLSPRASSLRVERAAGAVDEEVVLGDVDAQTDSGKSVKGSEKRGSGSGGRKDERRRKSGKGRKK